MRDVTKALTSVFSDSVSNERRTRLSWCDQKKHVLQTVETCLSGLRSAAIMTPRSQTLSLALMTSASSWSDGAQPPNVVSLCLADPEKLGLVGVQLQAIGRHPVADFRDTVFEFTDGRWYSTKLTVQVDL